MLRCLPPSTGWLNRSLLSCAQAERKRIEAEAEAAAAAAEKIREKEAIKAKKELEKAQKIMEREEQKAAKQALKVAQKEVCTAPFLLFPGNVLRGCWPFVVERWSTTD